MAYFQGGNLEVFFLSLSLSLSSLLEVQHGASFYLSLSLSAKAYLEPMDQLVQFASHRVYYGEKLNQINSINLVKAE